MIVKKETLREIIREEVERVLTVEIQVLQVRDEDTGVPLAHPVHKTEKVFLPAFFVQHLKFHEGAYRGMQETVDRAKNNSANAQEVLAEMVEKVDTLGNTLLSMEESTKIIGRFALALRHTGLLEQMEKALALPMSQGETG